MLDLVSRANAVAGPKLRRQDMKKGLLLMAVLGAFALVGCEKPDTDVEGPRKAPAGSTAPADADTKPGDAATSPAI